MLRHESEDMDLYTDPETWILQRILRYIWMLIYGSGDMDLAEEPEIQKMLRHEPKDVDLVKDP